MRKYLMNPENRVRVHNYAAIFWTLMIPLTIALKWYNSIPFLVAISLYAIITGHISSAEANRSELITKKQIEGEFDDIRVGHESLEDLLERKEKE
jgi:hypothetical protein